MFTNITFGKYIYKDSLIHKLHPFIKLISLILVLFMTFISDFYVNLLLLFLIIILAKLSKINLNNYFKNILSIKYFILFLVIINLIFKVDFLVILNNILKLIIVIINASVYMYTTTLVEINYGFKKLFSPLKKINIDKISLIITLSLKFIPIIIEQADLILKSLASRGLDFRGNIKEKLLSLKAMIIPLFVLSLKEADNISDIIEVRNYNLNKIVKNMKRKINTKDIIFLILNIIIVILVILKGVI